jgi:hypothetical protein
MNFIKTFENFNNNYINITSSKDRIVNELSYVYDLKEKSKDLSFDIIAKEAIDEFKSKINIFKKIHILWIEKDKSNTIAEYVHSSSLAGEPIILLYEDSIIKELESLNNKEEIDEEKDLIIKETIFHELGHAMVDIDNVYIFNEDSNVLQFEDEEEFVENFCRDFYMSKKVSNDILELAKLFKNKKFIGYDKDFKKEINY